jgi:hypothetical protein
MAMRTRSAVSGCSIRATMAFGADPHHTLPVDLIIVLVFIVVSGSPGHYAANFIATDEGST